MKEARKACVFISYRYPPDLGVGCLRNAHFVKLNHKFRKSIVITSENGLYADKKSAKSEIEIHYVANSDVKTTVHRNIPKVFSSILSRTGLNKMIKSTLAFPLWRHSISEGGRNYKNRATAIFRKIAKKNSISFIYSSYRPFVDHEIAMEIKEENCNIFWIADFRDYPSHFSELSSKDGLRIHEVLTTADQLLFSTSGLMDYYKAPKEKSRIIYSAYKTQIEKQASSRKFSISYAGSLYGKRALETFLIAMSKTRELIGDRFDSLVELKYMGINEVIWNKLTKKYHFKNSSNSQGLLSHEATLMEIFNSDLLLYLDWSDKDITGIFGYKLWDYLNSQKPIIVLSHGQVSDEVRSVLSDHDFIGNKNLENIEEKLAEYIYSVYLNTPHIDRSEILEEHTVRQIEFWSDPHRS